jgi:hypothetical protein
MPDGGDDAVERGAEEPLGDAISSARALSGQARAWQMKAIRERVLRLAIGDWREMVKELEQEICYAEMELAQGAAAQLALSGQAHEWPA